MLRTFTGARRRVFFPRSWANSVTRWILGLTSRSGTILVTPPAQDGEGASIDVNEAVLADRLARRFVSRTDPGGIDGESMELDGAGRLRVNTEWLDRFIRQRVKAASIVDG